VADIHEERPKNCLEIEPTMFKISIILGGQDSMNEMFWNAADGNKLPLLPLGTEKQHDFFRFQLKERQLFFLVLAGNTLNFLIPEGDSRWKTFPFFRRHFQIMEIQFNSRFRPPHFTALFRYMPDIPVFKTLQFIDKEGPVYSLPGEKQSRVGKNFGRDAPSPCGKALINKDGKIEAAKEYARNDKNTEKAHEKGNPSFP
jgi:hypothetical protein